MKKIKYVSVLFIVLTVSFLTYCFFPVFTYDVKYSKYVNIPVKDSFAPWRIYLEDRKWIVITDKSYKNGYYKYIKTDLNSEFVKSLLFIEDKKYYDHYWVNILSKFRAIKDNLVWKKISWWSTITEQYIKNKYFKSIKRSYLQKAREATLALYFNFKMWKDKILNIYYNDVYFWNNLYWVWAALEVYFWKDDLNDLTQEEIVLLISLLHNPWIKSLDEKYFKSYFEKVKKRLNYDFENKYSWKLRKKENIDIFPFVTLIKDDLVDITNNRVSIDFELQKYTRDIINQTLDELKDKNVTNAAVFAIIPDSWEVLIYQWSRNFRSDKIEWQVDVIKSFRQPWSTIKPFLYLLGLESWANWDDLILDIESEYNSFQKDKVYISENYSLKEYGLVRFKKALWNSFNNATVRLARELGLSQVYDFYKDYGFKLKYNFEHYGYSLVLWNPSITLEDLVRSYTKLLPIYNYSDLDNKLEETNKNKFLLYDILSDPDNRDVSFWVNSILNTSIFQAVKTWTSSEFRDNLVLSYHPDLILGVWVWNNDNSSMKWVTWITWAGYIWHNIIEKAIKLWYITDRKLKIPKGIVEDYYCLDTDCFRKELIYKKELKKYFSELYNGNYSKQDIFEKLSSFEISKLDEMWFNIK